MDKEKLKQELIKFAEWQENTILPDTNEEMVNDYLQYVVLPQADVIKSVCDVCDSTTDKPTYKLCDKHYAEYEKFKQTVL